MCNPSIYLVVTYFPTYLSIYETYLLQNWLSRWNQILTQLRFIYNWVIMGIQWMVYWWFNVARWLGEVLVKTQSTFLVLFFLGGGGGGDKPILLAHLSPKK
jgi:hypothetical protein